MIFLWAQRGRRCIFTKSALYLSGYSRYPWWSTGLILWFSELFISTWYFKKCHFLGFCELRVNHIHNCLNWLSEYRFGCHNISLARGHGFSVLAHIKTEARNQRIVEHDKRSALSNTQPRISKLAIRLKSQPLHWNVCGNQLPLEIKCYEMHFCGTNVVVVCCIFLEQHFVVIIMVITSYVLKKE